MDVMCLCDNIYYVFKVIEYDIFCILSYMFDQ